MNILCVENKNGNGNFTINKEYKIIKNKDKYFGDYIVTSDYIHIFTDKNIIEKIKLNKKDEEFILFFCKFKILN